MEVMSTAEDLERIENSNEVDEMSSLDEEETNPHWDVGSGDLAIYNDEPTDRNISRFLQRARSEVTNFLRNVLKRKRKIKYNIILQVRFSKEVLPQTPLKSHYISLENYADIDDTYDVLAALVDLKSKEFSCVHQILRIEINIKRTRRLSGSFIELPPKMSALKAVINFRNNNNYCFKYAILAGVKHMTKGKTVALETLDIRSDEMSYGGVSLNFSGLTYPLKVMDVRIFEENNPSVSVSVFGIQKCRTKHLVEPIYRTRRQRDMHFNLLFLENVKKYITHYAYISNLEKLIRGATKKRLSCQKKRSSATVAAETIASS